MLTARGRNWHNCLNREPRFAAIARSSGTSTQLEPSVTLAAHFPAVLVAILLGCSGQDRAAPPAAGTTGDSAPSPQSMTSGRVDTVYLTPPSTGPAQEYIAWNLPRWADAILHDGRYMDRYELFTGLNPYYVAGRLDADTLPDLAVQIREKASGHRGIAIIHRGSKHVAILGAGQPLGNGGDDWSWLWVWRVEDGLAEPDSAFRGHDVLLVEKPESAGGYLWWDGQSYRWTQAGD